MMTMKSFKRKALMLAAMLAGALAVVPAGVGRLAAQNKSNKVMGDVQFTPATDLENRAGVWVDGQYLGYLKELRSEKKITLLPGEHTVSARQAGFQDFTKTIVVEPEQTTLVPVKMLADPEAVYPGTNPAELKLNIKPKRAAVFVDERFVGNAGYFGGLNTMLVKPGFHRIKVELPGYRTFETGIQLRAG